MIIKLLNWFARVYIAEVLAGVRFPEAVNVGTPHAQFHSVVCIHGACVKYDR